MRNFGVYAGVAFEWNKQEVRKIIKKTFISLRKCLFNISAKGQKSLACKRSRANSRYISSRLSGFLTPIFKEVTQ